MKKLFFIWLLIAAMLAGCATIPPVTGPMEPENQVTTGPAEGQTLPQQPEETGGQEELLPEVTIPEAQQGSISDAPGTVSFYVGDVPLYCGQRVSRLLALPLILEGDVEELVQSGNYSSGIRMRMADDQGKFENNIYFIAVNPTAEALPLKDCLVYSLTFNCESGLRFGLGNSSFLTGKTTEAELTAAWGAPSHRYAGKDFQQLVYYRPFSFLQIIVRDTGVDQVIAYHNAYLYPELAGQAVPSDYLDSDALLLLSRYMDISPYLAGGKGVKRDLPLAMSIAGETIQLGIRWQQLPEPWRTVYDRTRLEVMASRYVTIERPNQEGFIFLNAGDSVTTSIYNMVVKGIIAYNPNYSGWYYAYSQHRGFDYQGVTHDSSIQDLISILGQPYEIVPASGPNCCFVWLHYESEGKDTLRFKVDPATNQIIEVRLEEYVYGTEQ